MRFLDEIKTYVGFTEEDAERLQRIGSILEPHFQDVVASFYEALMEHPRARGVFEGSEQVQRLRHSLKGWLRELFEGEYGEEYFISRGKIGMVHMRVGLKPQFLLGAMNQIRHQLTRRILEEERAAIEAAFDELQAAQECVVSLNRLLDIELTIIIQSYWDGLIRQRLQIPVALATGLAHELRNPLNAIGLQMTMLERRLQKSGVSGDIYESVMDAVRTELGRIQKLNAEILDFARPVFLECASVDLVGLIGEIHCSHGPTLEAGGVQLSVEGPPKVFVFADRERLREALVNLLTNAVEAMPEGGEVRVVLESNGAGVVVEFSDTGTGIEAEQAGQIFELFHTTKALGTGIGLPIARKNMEAHGGSIELAATSVKGTTFRLYFPMQSRWQGEGALR